MREIKFRAWDKEKKRFFVSDGYWENSLYVGLDGKLEMFDHEPYPRHFEEDRFILQQYTGLTDKNGKEIYEGDVVRILDYYAKVGIVEFSHPRFCIFDGDDGITDFDQEEWEYFEVIGNIYENPELLEKKGE